MNRADPRRVTAVVRIQEANPAHVTVSVWVGRQPGSRGRAGTLAFGARVGIVTCLRCGAAILLDPRESSVDALSVHRTWHEKGDDK